MRFRSADPAPDRRAEHEGDKEARPPASPRKAAPDTRPSRAWFVYLLLGLLFVAVYFLPGLGEGARGAMVVALGVVNAAVIVGGVRMNRPRFPVVWYLLAGSYLAAAAGNAVGGVYFLVSGDVPLPSPSDVFYLGGYGLLVAAAVILVRVRNPWGDWTGLVDAAIVATGALMLAWAFLISPQVEQFVVPFVGRAFLAVYPLLDVLLLAVVVRLMLGAGARPPAYWILVLGISATLASDALHGATVLAGVYEVGSPVDAGWLVAHFLGGVAALHPSMGAVAEPTPQGSARRPVSHDRRRLAVLAGVSLLGPALLVIQVTTGERVDAAAIFAGSAVMLALIVVRAAGILRALEKALEERRRSEAALRSSEQRLRAIVGNVPVFLFALDREGVFTLSEGKGLEALGLRQGESVGRSAFDVYGHVPEVAESFRRVLAGEEVSTTVELGGRVFESWYAPLWKNGGEPEAGEAESKAEGEARDEVLGVIGVGADVTERWRAEDALRESEARFRQLFGQSVDALVVHDASGEILDCNAQACRFLGYAREELLALRVRDLNDAPVSGEERRERGGGALWQRAASGDPDTSAAVVLSALRRKDGSTFPAEVRVGGVDYGGERMILASIRDVTERAALEGRLRHQALHDPLTGLPNRTLFAGRLGRAQERAEQRGGMVAVLFLDLDNFKVVNDSLGHEAGDRLLAAVGRRLLGLSRPADTVARLGGDEFVILLGEVSGTRDAARAAEGVVEALREPFRIEGVRREVFVSASVGIAFGRSGREGPEELLRRADLAMYKAKDTGKGHHEVYDPSLNVRVQERLRLESALRQAVEKEEIRLHYQPKVSLRTGAVVGFEALMRWNHPGRGLLSPTEFVPLAEETGLILPLERQALREACAQARRWRGHGPEGAAPTVSVNLSAHQFRRRGLVREVEQTLEEAGLEPGALTLELTETAAMEDPERTVRTLKKLKNLGVGLALDDFGTGHSSLAQLKRFPVDEIKIDRSITEGIERDPGDRAIVAATIMVARALDLKVVAEGVETEDQIRELLSLGCDVGQGYYWRRPGSPESVEDLLGLPPGHRLR